MSESSGVTGKAFDLKLFRRVISYARPYRAVFALCILLTFLLSFLAFARPVLVMFTINEYIVDHPDTGMLTRMFFILLSVLLTEALFHYLNSYYTSWLGQHIIRDIRVQLFHHISGLKSKYFDNTPIGMLVTRTVSDIEAIEEIFSQGFIVIAGDILTLTVYVSGMFIIDWRLSLITLSTLPLLLIATWVFKNAVKSAFQDVRTQIARLNAFTQEHITGMKIVQVFHREEKELEKFREINKMHRDANIRSVWHYSVFFPIVEVLSSVSIGLLVWRSGADVFSGRVGVGEIVFFLMIVQMFFRPIRMLADRINTLQMGMVASERVFKVLDTRESISDNGKYVPEKWKGALEVKNLWFAYNKEHYVIKGISFKANPGETLAIVGATGAGKSSIINLLNRSYEFNNGEILLDGVNIRDYDLPELRRSVGVVLQDVFLFSDTIRNNITLYQNIPDAVIEESAKAIGAWEFISRLPGGLDFNVMERGAVLSAGQRQLIAFIRAYVFKPHLLILDEATSSVDTESELMIQRATQKITEGRTSIVIAHRLATVQKADRILVMDGGEIIEEGSHQELLRKNGAYRKLFDLQFS
ncbi:MAG: ABC transporter ATP-binding protein [Bacteroidia bacterium]|nr:ABC transporter ATP-binding protein [Bacteroidia bacterium]